MQNNHDHSFVEVVVAAMVDGEEGDTEEADAVAVPVDEEDEQQHDDDDDDDEEEEQQPVASAVTQRMNYMIEKAKQQNNKSQQQDEEEEEEEEQQQQQPGKQKKDPPPNTTTKAISAAPTKQKPKKAFVYFVQEQYPNINKASHPEQLDTIKYLKDMWRNLSNEQRQKYIDQEEAAAAAAAAEAADQQQKKKPAAVVANNGSNNKKNTNNNKYPANWSIAACQKYEELEYQLQNIVNPASRCNRIRIDMIVGFAATIGISILDETERTAFYDSLCDYLRSKGHFTSTTTTAGAAAAAAAADTTPSHDNNNNNGNSCTIESQIVLALSAQQRALQEAPPLMVPPAAAAAATGVRKPPQRKKMSPKSPTSYNKNYQGKQKQIVYEGPVTEPLEGCGDMTGWMKRSRTREAGNSAGRPDHYWYTPVHKCVLRSTKEIQRFFQYMNDKNDPVCYGDEKKAVEKARLAGKRGTPGKNKKKAPPPSTTENAAAAASGSGSAIAPPPKKKARRASKGPKDKNQPKAHMAAYNIFLKEQMSNIKMIFLSEYEDDNDINDPTSQDYITPEQIEFLKGDSDGNKFISQHAIKLIAQRWRNLSQNRRAHYQELSNQDKIRYQQEMEIYNNKTMAAAMAAATEESTTNVANNNNTNYDDEDTTEEKKMAATTTDDEEDVNNNNHVKHEV